MTTQWILYLGSGLAELSLYLAAGDHMMGGALDRLVEKARAESGLEP